MTFLQEFGTIDETLLLEFAYFGRLTKKAPNPHTLDPFEYLEKTVWSDEEDTPEMAESDDEFGEMAEFKPPPPRRHRGTKQLLVIFYLSWINIGL